MHSKLQQTQLSLSEASLGFLMHFYYLYYKQINMINQSFSGRQQTSSRQKMQAILQEQQEVSKAFNINNFYQNERLNIRELKMKLDAFKRKKAPQSPFKKKEQIVKTKLNASYQDKSTAKFAGQYLPLTHQNNGTLSNIKKKLNFDPSNPFSQQPSTRKQQQYVSNSGLWKPNVKNETDYKTTKIPRYDSKTKTVYNPRGDLRSRDQILNSKQWQRKRCNTGQKSQQSKCSDTSFQKSFQQCNFQGKINLQNQGQMSQFENKITLLWSHYQLVTRLLISLRDGFQKQKPTIVKYISIVCSQQFQFLKELLQQLLIRCNNRKEIAFAKRLKKAVILSRLYQNMAIVYLSMYICLDLKTESNLTNFIGYSTSNITFLIKLLVLLHRLQNQLHFAENTQVIIEAITEYEKGSYSKKIVLISEVILRMEQNNQVIAIVNNKLCRSLDPSFQDIVSDFLKNVDLDTKPFLEYAHYIFQFLAFHLAQVGVRGQFIAVQMAPAPYYPMLPKQRTIVIEPWQVLFAFKGTTTYIRAHTEHFLKTVGHYWNLVYWTDLMPKGIDDLLKKLPDGLCLYQYHCKFQRQNYVKLLDRIGCDINNTVIIDRSQENYRNHKQHGISLPWKGNRRDVKLLELLKLLQPLFLEKTSLRSCFGSVRSKIAAAFTKKRGGKSQLHTHVEEHFQEMLPQRISTNYV